MGDFINEKIMPLIDKFTNSRVIKILMNGFMGVAALTIGGSLFAMLRSLPLGDWYTNFLISTGLFDILNFPIMITSDLISLYLVLSFGYFTAKSYDKNAFSGAMISLGAFLILTPFEMAATLTDEAGATVTGMVTGVLPIGSFGATGIFLSMIVGIGAARIYVWCLDKNFRIRMPASVPSNVTNMFETMIPATIVFILFIVVRVVLQQTPFHTAQDLIYTVLQAPLTSVAGGFWGFVVYTLVAVVLWTFGIHGSMVVYSGMAPIYMAMVTANLSAFAAGTPCPNPEWNFLPYTLLGGAGCTFALNLLMLTRAKSQHLKTLGKIALPTSFFEINEPLIFGTPMILNPMLAVPFIACPMVNLFLSYAVMKIGLVAAPTGVQLSCYLPIGVFGAMNNGHWTGFVWTLVLLAVDLVIWYPFFMKYDASKLAEETSD